MIHCCECDKEVDARPVTGKQIYPHRSDLWSKKFYRCPCCSNYVGCHPGPKHKPLGSIPTPELRKARSAIHAMIDPVWKRKHNRLCSRSRLYHLISEAVGYRFHTAEINTIGEARRVYRIAQAVVESLKGEKVVDQAISSE